MADELEKKLAKAVAAIAKPEAEIHAVSHEIDRLLRNIKKRGVANLAAKYLQTRLDLLNQHNQQAVSLNTEINLACDVTIHARIDYFTKNYWEELQKKIDSTEDFITEHLNKLLKKQEDSILSRQSTMYEDVDDPPLNTPSAAHNLPITAGVKLPKLTLPTFNGEYSEWANFRDQFVATIGDNKELSDVQKLMYLKSQLTDTAAELLSSVTTTQHNYKTAWSTLTERYDNQRMMVMTLMKRITSLPNVNAKDLTKLRHFRDTYQVNFQLLGNLGCPIIHWDIPMVHLLTSKFHTDLGLKWQQTLTKSKECSKLKHLDTFLEKEIRALEGYYLSSDTPPDKQFDNRQSGSRPVRGHNASLQENRNTCPVCRENHSIYSCSKFKALTPADRCKFAQENKLCINCLGIKHAYKDCKSQTRCKKCAKPHHTLLHFPQPGEDKEEQENEPKDETIKVGISVTPNNSVLLATALVRVTGPDGIATIIRALIDPGSEASLMSEDLVKQLHLTTDHVNTPVAGIGASSVGNIQHKANLTVQSRSDTESTPLGVSAYILSKIIDYAPLSVSPMQHPELEGLTLADPEPTAWDPIELLLGADIYGQILQDGLRKLAGTNLIAQNTIFGWILLGPTTPTSNSET